MAFSLKRIEKYKRWLTSRAAGFRANARFSPRYARLCLRLDTAQLLHRPQAAVDRRAAAKHAYILAYLREKCPRTLEKYAGLPAPAGLCEPQEEIKLWSMWWQGEENAAPLFKTCIDSARRHTRRPVTVLSRENFRKYFDIPDFILQKLDAGKISLQHVCDLMVVSVLARQGGFFIGATVWCSQDVPEAVLRAPFYTCKAASERPYFMSRSRWVGYLLAGRRDFPLFGFARDFLLEYWAGNDAVLDYLLLDYVFELAYETVPCVREAIDALPDNNLLRNELIERLSEPYDEAAFRRFAEGDTMFYKLSWKFGDKREETPDGRPTNWGHMRKEAEHDS